MIDFTNLIANRSIVISQIKQILHILIIKQYGNYMKLEIF